MANKLFSKIQMAHTRSNVFDLTHDVKMSATMGKLYPCCLMEAVPGDKFSISGESLIRFAPLVAPVMHRMDVTIHYFFVPNRLVWPEWETFITGDPTAGVSATFPFIYIDDAVDDVKSLAAYFGLAIPSTPLGVNAIPFAAYQMIYNEYYRDQNLVDEVDYKLINGDNTLTVNTLKTMRRRAWEHDYFTSALPFAQKGQPVTIPLEFPDVPVARDILGEPMPVGGLYGVMPSSGNAFDPVMNIEATNNTSQGPDMQPDLLYARTSSMTPYSNVNDLRRAYRLQEWLERAARGGTRYIESILAHFGVKSSDARLNRPEYITGVKSPVVISEVLNTDGGTLPQGNMAGHAISVNTGKYGSYFCEEHGYVMGIMSVMPKPAYMQGIPRHFLKNDPLDFYWPSFAHLGEQEITNREIYADHTSPNGVFGYIPRYAEYKFQHNRVAGDFLSNLDYWHLTRAFASEPDLNEQFIECNPTDRVFAVNNGDDNLYCHILNKVRCSRKMPIFGSPSM